jgi:hypothetical protein
MIEWKSVKDYENHFSVSNTGLFRNDRTNKVLKQTIHKTGYYLVSTKPNGKYGKAKTFRVHREIAIAFLPNIDNKPTVNHIDGNKLNNSISNLEWATHKEQVIHAIENNLVNTLMGSNCHFSRLTDEQVKQVLDNPHIKNIEFARLFNIDRSAISKLRSGKNWKHLRAK